MQFVIFHLSMTFHCWWESMAIGISTKGNTMPYILCWKWQSSMSVSSLQRRDRNRIGTQIQGQSELRVWTWVFQWSSICLHQTVSRLDRNRLNYCVCDHVWSSGKDLLHKGTPNRRYDRKELWILREMQLWRKWTWYDSRWRSLSLI